MCLVVAVQMGLSSGCREGPVVEQEGGNLLSLQASLQTRSLGVGMGCPAEGAVWAHLPLISSLYFGPKLVLTCLQWFPTPKELGHRGLKKGERGCLFFVL